MYSVYIALIGMNIADYVGIFVSEISLSFNVIILQFEPTFNVRFSGLVYNLSIYSVYNQVSVMNISDNYVISCLVSS